MLIDILIALAVVAAVAFVFGLLLALVYRFFGFEENKDVKAIREALPGINCGACGYKGCDDYAASVADGSAAANLCVPGAEETARTIGEILGVEVESPKDVIAFVHCNGCYDATGDKMRYEGITTCNAAALIFGGPKACHYGCIGFGDCSLVCPVNAICIMDGVARVDSSRCLGCGLCMETCPHKMISMVPKNAAVAVICNSKEKGAAAKRACNNACIACKKCERACAFGAVKVINNVAVIDYDKCTNCNACADACPTKCIKKTEFAKRVI